MKASIAFSGTTKIAAMTGLLLLLPEFGAAQGLTEQPVAQRPAAKSATSAVPDRANATLRKKLEGLHATVTGNLSEKLNRRLSEKLAAKMNARANEDMRQSNEALDQQIHYNALSVLGNHTPRPRFEYGYDG